MPKDALNEATVAVESTRMLALALRATRAHCWLQSPRGRYVYGFTVDLEAPASEPIPCSVESLYARLPEGHHYDSGIAAAGLHAVRGALQASVSQFASSYAAWQVLEHEGRTFAVLCLERKLSVGGISADELMSAERLVPLIRANIRVELQYSDSLVELAVARALRAGHRLSLVFSVDCEQIVWASWPDASRARIADEVLEASLRTWLTRSPAASEREAEHIPDSVRACCVVRAAPIALGGYLEGRCFAIALSETGVPDSSWPGAAPALSHREEQIVKLLCEGHESINVAALTGLSEHTVRTYIRRAYRKLQVNNRADLVRRMLGGAP
ncbi:MAG TPA: helix-turn-helix transcriptional regulator [Polyangiaceae bacterium]|nr:helix-turn-helix transcriptional regulator [Polyangiaceae bacterium]